MSEEIIDSTPEAPEEGETSQVPTMSLDDLIEIKFDSDAVKFKKYVSENFTENYLNELSVLSPKAQLQTLARGYNSKPVEQSKPSSSKQYSAPAIHVPKFSATKPSYEAEAMAGGEVHPEFKNRPLTDPKINPYVETRNRIYEWAAIRDRGGKGGRRFV